MFFGYRETLAVSKVFISYAQTILKSAIDTLQRKLTKKPTTCALLEAFNCFFWV